jgi:hypothetical protein
MFILSNKKSPEMFPGFFASTGIIYIETVFLTRAPSYRCTGNSLGGGTFSFSFWKEVFNAVSAEC